MTAEIGLLFLVMGPHLVFVVLGQILFATLHSYSLRKSLIIGAVILVVGTLAKRAYAIYAKRRSRDDSDD